MKKSAGRGLAVAVVAAVLMAGSAQALTFNLNTTFAGTYVGADWLTLTADGNDVLLNIQADLGSAFMGVGGLGLNFDPTKSTLLAAMTWSLVNKSAGAPLPTSFEHAQDTEKMDGDGLYDVWFGFPTAGSGDRFNQNDWLTLRLSSSGQIAPLDFDFWSTPAGGWGPFQAAAHIQNTPTTIENGANSLWIRPGVNVPDGGITVLLLGMSLTAVALLRSRFSR